CVEPGRAFRSQAPYRPPTAYAQAQRTASRGAAAYAHADCFEYQWLCSVLRGHFVYFGLPSNLDRIHAFYRETCRLWYRALNRRNQRRFSLEQFVLLLKRFPLPTPSIIHPRPAVAW